MNMHINFKRINRALLICFLVAFIMACVVGCSSGGHKSEGSAESNFRKQMENAEITEVTVNKKLVLESPVEVVGTKVILGQGSITAVGDWAENGYMLVVPGNASLTVKGSVVIDAANRTGGIHVAANALCVVDEEAAVKRASVKYANVLVEGDFQLNGGSLADARGNNLSNKGRTVIKGGSIVGSGKQYAGVCNEGSLTQNGGTISGAYNNVVVLTGGNFVWNGGENKDSVREGIFVGEGAQLSVTSKNAVLTKSGVSGIYLCGSAVIDNITLNNTGDSLIKVMKGGHLKLNGGNLTEGGYHGIDNAGTLEMTGGTIRNNYNCGIVNTGILKVTGGIILDHTANKGILNKHAGHATISGEAVMLSGNKIAIGNEDTAHMDLSGASILLSTTTNVYAYGGTMNIHDITLGASGSNNVRIVAATVEMSKVDVMGNTQTGSGTTHGVLLEGGVLNATDVNIKNTTGYGIRNKGGYITAKNLFISTSTKSGGINNTRQDFTGRPGVIVVENLTFENIRYNNIVCDDGEMTVNKGLLAASGTNNVKMTGGVLNLNDVDVMGNIPGMAGTNHAIYSIGGTLVMKNVNVQDAATSGIRVNGETAVITGTNVTVQNSRKYAIDQTVGTITIDNLKTSNNYYNVENKGGSITLKNSVLGATKSNNVRNYSGKIYLENVTVEGHAEDHPANVHAIFVSGGDVSGKDVTIAKSAYVGLRVAAGTATFENLSVHNVGGDGVQATAGVTVLKNLSFKNVNGGGVAANNGAKVTVMNSILTSTASHTAKSEGNALLTLENVSLTLPSIDGRHAVLSQSGAVHLEKVSISGLKGNSTGAAIRINRDTSRVTGNNIQITGVNIGVSGAAGTSNIYNMTTDDIGSHSALATGTAKLVITNSHFGMSGTNNAKVESGGTLTLVNTVIDGTLKNHGVMVEKNGHFYGEDLTISNTASAALRVITSKKGSYIEVDGLTTSNLGGMNIWISADEDLAANKQKGGIIVKNGDLCKTKSHSITVDAGNLTMVDTQMHGHYAGTANNVHTIYILGGKVDLNHVTILDTAGDALRVSGGTVTAKNFTSVHTGRHGVFTDGGSLTLSDSLIGGTTEHGIINKGTELYLNNVTFGEIGDSSVVYNMAHSNGTPGKVIVNGMTVEDDDSGLVALHNADETSNIELRGGVLTLPLTVTGIYVEKGSAVVNNAWITGGQYAVRNAATFTMNNGWLFNNIWALHNEATGSATLNGGYYFGNVTGTAPSDLFNAGLLTISDITVGYNPTGIGTSGVIYQAMDAQPIVLKGTKLGLHTPSKPITVVAEDWEEKWGVRHTIITCDSVEAAMDVKGCFATGKNDPTLYISRRENTLELTTLPGGNYIVSIGAEMFESFEEAFLYMEVKGMTEATLQVVDSFKLFEAVEIPAGYKITLTDDGRDNHVITCGDINGHMFTVGADSHLILSSTNDTISSLRFDGAKKAETAVIYVDGGKFTVSSDIGIANSTYGVYVVDGDFTATANSALTISGSAENGIYVTGGSLTANNVTISGSKIGIRVTGGTAALNGTNISGSSSNNIHVSGGELTINGYADSSKSQVGTSTVDNIVATNGGIIRLNNVDVKESKANNIVTTGGKIYLTNTSVSGGIYSVLVQTAGYAELKNVTITDPVRDAIRVNAADGKVVVNNVEISNPVRYGISADKGTVEVKGDLTISSNTGESRAIYAYNSGKVVADNDTKVTITGTEYGIYSEANSTVSLDEVAISGVKTNSVYVDGNQNNDGDNTGVTIKRGTIGTTAYAFNIYVENGGKLSLCNTEVVSEFTEMVEHTKEQVNATIHLYNSGAVTLDNVSITGGVYGLRVHTSKDVKLNNLTINNVTAHGIYQQASAVLTVTGELKINKAGNRGVQINSGTFDASGATKIEIVDAGGIGLENRGTAITNNLSITTTKSDATHSHNIKTSGSLTLNGTTVLGQSNSQNLLVDGAKAEVILNGTVTIGGTDSNNGLRVINSGKATVNGTLTIHDVKVSGINVESSGTVTIADTAVVTINNCGNGIYVNKGTVNLNGTVEIDTCKTYVYNEETLGGHGVELTSGAVNIAGKLTVKNAAVNGIYVSGGVFTAEVDSTVTVSGGIIGMIASGNAQVELANFAASGYANSALQILDTAKVKINYVDIGGNTNANTDLIDVNGAVTVEILGGKLEGAKRNNIRVQGDATVTVQNVEFGKSGSNNIDLRGGHTYLTDVQILGNDRYHGVQLSGGNATMTRVTISGAKNTTDNSAAIRINNANSALVATDLTITDCVRGFSMNNGSVNLSGTISISNIANEGILLEGGTLNANGELNISECANRGLNVTGTGKVTLGGNVTVSHSNKKSWAIVATAGGSIVAADGTKVTISNTEYGIVSWDNSVISLDEVAISGVKNNSIYVDGNGNTDAERTGVTIKRGSIGTTAHAFNVYVFDGGKLSLSNVDVVSASTVTTTHTSETVNATIHVWNAASVSLNNVSITGGMYGLRVHTTKDVKLNNLTINDVTKHGIYQQASAVLTVTGTLKIDGAGTNGIQVNSGTIDASNATKVEISNVTKRGIECGGTFNVSELAITGAQTEAVHINGKLNATKVTVDVANIGVYSGNANAVLVIDNLITKNVTTKSVFIEGGASLTINAGDLCFNNDHNVQVNGNSTLNIHNVTFGGTKNYAALRIKGGKVTASNLTFKDFSQNAIQIDAGTTEINGLTVSGITKKAISLYGSGVLTVKNATLSNTGADNVIHYTAGTLNLENVTVNNTTQNSGTYDIYCEGANLSLSGKIDAGVYFGKAVAVNVTGELTGNLVVDWKTAPTGTAISFASEAIMDASKDNITLGATQADAGSLLYYHVDGENAVATLANKVVTSEAELNDYLAAAVDHGMKNVTIELGDSFTVANQVTIPAGITSLTVDGEDKTITYDGSAEEIFLWNDCTTLSLNNVTINGNVKGNVNVPANKQLNLANVTILKPKSRGIQFNGTVHMSGSVAVDNTGSTANVWAVSGATGGVLTCDAGTTLTITACQHGFVANNNAEMTIDNLIVKDNASSAIYMASSKTMTVGNVTIAKENKTASVGNAIYANKGTLKVNGGTADGGADLKGTAIVELKNLSITNNDGNNITVSASANVTLNNVTVTGSGTATNQHGILMSGGSIAVKGTLTVQDASGAGIRLSNGGTFTATEAGAKVVVSNTGTHGVSNWNGTITIYELTVTNPGKHGVIADASGTNNLSNVTITGTTAGNHDIYITSTTDKALQLSGNVNAEVYMNVAKPVYINGELTGNLIVDWKTAPTGTAISFASEAIMDASKDNITLGATQADAGSLLYYHMDGENAVATLANKVVTSETELNDYLNAAVDLKMTTVEIVIGADIEVEKTVDVPAGMSLTITDDGNVRTIKRASTFVSGPMFNLNEAGRTLNLVGTSADESRLIIDGMNVAANNGRLIRNIKSTVTIRNAKLTGANVTSNSAGFAVYSSGKLVMENVIVSGNTLANNRAVNGAVAIAGGTENLIQNCVFENNTAAGASGGALAVAGTASVTIDSCSFSGNTAKVCGDIYVEDKGDVTVLGDMNGSIYFAKAVALNVSGELTGNLVVDWKTAPTGTAISFASEEVMNASKDNITLGSTAAKNGYILKYTETTAQLVKATVVTSWTDLVTQVGAVQSGAEAYFQISGDADWSADSVLTIPAGANVTLLGTEASPAIVRASTYTAGSLISVPSGATLTLQTATGTVDAPQLIISGGDVAATAQMITSQGNLNVLSGVQLSDSVMSGKQAGAAIYATGGTLTLDGAVIKNNVIKGAQAGAVFVNNLSQVSVTDSLFSGNEANSGGAISGTKATVNISGTTFQGNIARQYGGAIFTNGGLNLVISDSKFDSNEDRGTPGYGGGAILLFSKSSLEATNTEFTNNKELVGKGGAVHVDGNTAVFNGCTFTGNTAAQGGSTIHVTGTSNVSAKDCTFGGAEQPADGEISGTVTIE